MNSKKQILFIMNNLNVGGAEKALISILQNFDYSKYNVDLYLFKKEGGFLNQVPDNVQILPIPEDYKYFDGSFVSTIVANLKMFNLSLVLDRIRFTFLQKMTISSSEKEQRSWKLIKNHIPKIDKHYDVAVGFLEKTPIYFCTDNVSANKKIGFIHNDYEALGLNPKYDISTFGKLNYIVSVSEKCVDILKKVFPQFKEKVFLIENISSSKIIQKLAQEENNISLKKISIISVGRLSPQKNFELAISASVILKEKGFNFEWNILGEGNERPYLESLIAANNLSKFINLLGLKKNPYSYIFKSLIYVQPSKFEGKSIAIDEAKILLKPIIVTDFPTAKDQITHGLNGLIAEMNADSLAKEIERLILDGDLRKHLSENLFNEKIGAEDEILKLYQLIDE